VCTCASAHWVCTCVCHRGRATLSASHPTPVLHHTHTLPHGGQPRLSPTPVTEREGRHSLCTLVAPEAPRHSLDSGRIQQVGEARPVDLQVLWDRGVALRLEGPGNPGQEPDSLPPTHLSRGHWPVGGMPSATRAQEGGSPPSLSSGQAKDLQGTDGSLSQLHSHPLCGPLWA
jgi:hypothetical protein